MSSAAEFETPMKNLAIFKDMPLWLLAGSALSLAIIWLMPPFRAALPEWANAWIPAGTILLTVLTICNAISILGHRYFENRRATAERDRKRLALLYGPLCSLFLTRHITAATSTNAPRFRHRLANATDELSYRRRMFGIKRAFRALFDRQESTSAEVEYGGDFPLADILKITRRQSEYADVTLLNLVQSAGRSRHEEFDSSSLLTEAELELFEHISLQHRRLVHRVS